MKFILPRGFAVLFLSLLVYLPSLQAQPDQQSVILFLAGRPSHGYGAHEHYAGCQLLAKSLEEAMDNVTTQVIRTKWPTEGQLAIADVIVMYSDGGGGHPVNKHLEQVDRLAKSGVGIVCIHYAVEVPKGKSGEKFLDWIGGYFETDWSVNPHWRAEFTELPDHPVTRGVNPFSSQDEWYYHMRFRDNMQGVTPILSAIPPESTLSRPDGPHSGNPHVRAKAGQPQHVAWATEREDGGRGFGFTGGHFHWNWGNDDFRRLMLNAIVWTAKQEVPENGVPIENVNLAALKDNQDFDEPKKLDVDKIRKVHGIDSK
ncbi:MAG: ThuA domain-containing protein [Pirellulaceae bacterium]|nr:ThuA domain-containing protein [Pirellulaceae bacterium]